MGDHPDAARLAARRRSPGGTAGPGHSDVLDATGEPVEVQVRRSTRRTRTVSAYRDGARVIVNIPARFTRAEQEQWVATMLARLAAGEQRRRGGTGDAELTARAVQLSRRYLDGRAQPTQVRWVANMRSRWASCTPGTGVIRVSDRLREVPSWVRDYVLVHELAHLIVADHSPRFWSLVGRFPRTERARGYLDGLSAAAGLSFADDLAGDLLERADDLTDEALADEALAEGTLAEETRAATPGPKSRSARG